MKRRAGNEDRWRRRTQARGVEIAASDLWQTVKGDRQVLHGVSLTVHACELVAIVGGSGAGKTTLLEALAGVRPAERGEVRFDGVDLYANFDSFRRLLGYVPQDDIIHADLPLERTLRYAAALRLPESRSSAEVDAAVDRALAALDLSARADVQVGALSGGQRKRASIAVELLTSPPVFFLDEPTSGLDPASSSELTAAAARSRRRRLDGALHDPFGAGPGLLRPRGLPRSRGPPRVRGPGR